VREDDDGREPSDLLAEHIDGLDPAPYRAVTVAILLLLLREFGDRLPGEARALATRALERRQSVVSGTFLASRGDFALLDGDWANLWEWWDSADDVAVGVVTAFVAFGAACSDAILVPGHGLSVTLLDPIDVWAQSSPEPAAAEELYRRIFALSSAVSLLAERALPVDVDDAFDRSFGDCRLPRRP